MYLPMVPELAIAMLACARIGVIHSIVFGGYSSEALKDRINDSKAKMLITADGSFRNNKVYPLKQNADEALKECKSIRHVIVVQRTNSEVKLGKKELDALVEEHGPGVRAWTTLKFLQGIGTISGSEFTNRKNIQNVPDPMLLDQEVMTKYLDYWEDAYLNFEEYRDVNLKEEAKRTQLNHLNIFNRKKC